MTDRASKLTALGALRFEDWRELHVGTPEQGAP